MANESNKIYTSQLCQFRVKVQHCKMSLNRKMSNKRARCEVLAVVLVKFQVFWKITSFPLVNRYWRLKGAWCCHVQGLCSLRKSISWRQHDPQNISNWLPNNTELYYYWSAGKGCPRPMIRIPQGLTEPGMSYHVIVVIPFHLEEQIIHSSHSSKILPQV